MMATKPQAAEPETADSPTVMEVDFSGRQAFSQGTPLHASAEVSTGNAIPGNAIHGNAALAASSGGPGDPYQGGGYQGGYAGSGGGATPPGAPPGGGLPESHYDTSGPGGEDPEGPPARRGRWGALLLSLGAVAAFAAVVWFAYDWGMESGYREEIPTITADGSPVKVKPENPGGMVVPNQDKLILNPPEMPEEEGVERLLSGPEAPEPGAVTPEAAEGEGPDPANDPIGALVEAQVPETAEGQGGSEQAVAGQSGSEQAGQAGASTPETAEPQAAASQPASPEPAAPATPQVAQAPAEPQPVQPAPEPQAAQAPEANAGGSAAAPAGGSASTASGAASGAGSASGGAAGGGAASPTATQVVAVTKGDYVIQLASVTSEEAARAEWKRLQGVHPGLLGDMNLALQQATVNGTLYHRIQTGPFPSRATAQDVCAQLKAKGQACIVQQR